MPETGIGKGTTGFLENLVVPHSFQTVRQMDIYNMNTEIIPAMPTSKQHTPPKRVLIIYNREGSPAE